MKKKEIVAIALLMAVAMVASVGAAPLDEARKACEIAQAKVAESARFVEDAKDALAKAKADKAAAPEYVKELKGFKHLWA